MAELAFFIDYSRCIGCQSCVQACQECDTHRGQSMIHLETIARHDSVQTAPQVCMHCEDPICARVCPADAIKQTPDGVTQSSLKPRCIGCSNCVLACPFGVPKYEWGKVLPKVQKCTMCGDRVAAGQQTACADICPTGATKFGERDDLIQEAQQRIRDNPGRYINHIYGLTEVGGTSVLLLSSVPFEEFGYRADLSRDPLPILTYRVLSRIPDFVPLGGMLLGGVWWITHRREAVAAAEAADAAREHGNQKGGKQ